MTVLLEQPAETPDRPAPPRSRAVWWAIPPLVIVLVVAVYPLLRVCLESFKGKPGESGWSTWTSVLLALVGLGRIRGRAAVR